MPQAGGRAGRRAVVHLHQPRSSGAVLLDLAAGAVQHEPLGAERFEALAVGLTRASVLHEPVERMPVVGNLLDTAEPRGCAQLRRRDAGAGVRLAGRSQRWPRLGAHSGAFALGALVLLEQVKRSTAA